MKLRPAQEEILKYRQGRLAVNAVPGSGKTFTLALLASVLIADNRIEIDNGQQVLIVTYLNSSVETFRDRIRRLLHDQGLSRSGYEVRTLHSLAHEIVQLSLGSRILHAGEVTVADNIQVEELISRATDQWLDEHPEFWRLFPDDNNPRDRLRRRTRLEDMAARFLRTAKNEQFALADIEASLSQFNSYNVASSDHPNHLRNLAKTDILTDQSFLLLEIMTGIYGFYQKSLSRLGALDFDDLVWNALSALRSQTSLAEALRAQWPYVLEDEAQDSVPLQTQLLAELTGRDGNWVRVGDPNQAITSTFTAAHPSQFVSYFRQPDVERLPLPNSGRCAPLIFNAANDLMNWTCDHHPVSEVRRNAFLRQEIKPTPKGDAQPNPSNDEARMTIRVFTNREEDELPQVARAASLAARRRPEETVAILVPTNNVGRKIADHLDSLKAPYDDLLRGGQRVREIAAALHCSLALISDPLDRSGFVRTYASLSALGHPAAGSDLESDKNIEALLRSITREELFLYAENPQNAIQALPPGVADEDQWRRLVSFANFVRRIFEFKMLPVEDLILALSDELFLSLESAEGRESDLAIAYYLAQIMKQWRELHPSWRLPDLVAQLEDVVEGRRQPPISRSKDLGFDPLPGRITLSTQHGAKGMEWDTVFLVGIDAYWIPGDLGGRFQGIDEEFGGDPSAEVIAQLRFLMHGDSDIFQGRTATESSQIEVIAERLRLLYVGITRAKRRLHLSRSKRIQMGRKAYHVEPSSALGVLHRYLKGNDTTQNS